MDPLKLVLLKEIDSNCLQTVNGTLFYWTGSSNVIKELYVIIDGKKVVADLPSTNIINPSVCSDAFYCTQESFTKKQLFSFLIKVSIVEGSLKVEELKKIIRDAECTISTSQPFYMQVKPNQINVNHFEPETFQTKIFRADTAIGPVVHPSVGKVIIVKTRSVDLFYPSEMEGILNLEINGDSLKVYAQNELDHVYVLDRQTGKECEPSMQTGLFNIAGVFEDKVILTAAAPGHATQLLAARIPESMRKDERDEMVVETTCALLQKLNTDESEELSGKAELAEAKGTIVSLQEAIAAMEDDMRRVLGLAKPDR